MRREHDATEMPLLHWTPPGTFALFPLSRRVGKIRHTAAKLATKSTARHATAYRRQVTDSLVGTMQRTGVSRDQMQRELSAFWQAVECEQYRLGRDLA